MIAATEEAPDFQCSIIQHAGDTDAKPFGFRDAMSGIRTGRWAKGVEAVRLAYAHAVENPPEPRVENGKMETPEEAMARGIKDATDRPKKNLPGILFSGTFSYRAKDRLLVHSGLICADLDKLNERTGAVFDQICADPHVLACFRSPTAYGLKVVFRVDPLRPHEDSYFALEKYVANSFGLAIDSACKDVSRICFASHDPEAFIADNAEPLPYPEKEPFEFHPQVLGLDLRPGDDYDSRHNLPELLTKHSWSKCQGGWSRPGKSTGLSATFDKVPGRFHVFSSSAEPFKEKGNYKPWHVYAILEHNGDFSAAAKALAALGYGAQPKKQKTDPVRRDEHGEVLQPISPEEARELALKALFARRVTVSNPPKEPVTRLFLAGKPIATPGNVQTMTAKAKTGKTAATGATVAAVICAATGTAILNHDTFKFTASNPAGHAVIVIDTEQSQYDAWACYQRNLARAGTDQDPAWLLHFALVGYSVKTRKEALSLALEYAKTTFGGVFLVVLDGVAHFVSSVNELEECNVMADWLRELSVTYDTAMLCIIHSNEGAKSGDDSRGHLGKQLMRDAESNLLLKKNGEVTTITSDIQRKAPITEDDGVAFKWSDQHGRHVLCDASDAKAKGGRPPAATFDSLDAIWPKTADKAMTKMQLLLFAKDEDDISETTLRRIIKLAVHNGQLVKLPSTIGNKYHLPTV